MSKLEELDEAVTALERKLRRWERRNFWLSVAGTFIGTVVGIALSKILQS